MNREYLKYTVEELLDNKVFVAWVLKGRDKDKWQVFLDEYPEMRESVVEARRIILTVQDTYDTLSEDEVLKMWHNIEQFGQAHKKKARLVQLRKLASVAASVLLIISIGIFGFLQFGNSSSEYQFVSSDLTDNHGETRLVLADGEEVILNKNKSTISINDENEIIINDEQTIDLTKNSAANTAENKMNEVIVPYGKSSVLLLADGTKVWLNAGSRLAFPTEFLAKNRKVFLEGEACFKVTKNAEQPFVVNANNLDVRVLGTHFNVAAYSADDNIETVLIEGKVELTKNTGLGLSKKSVVLKPFQKATFSKDNENIAVVDEPNADAYIAWTEGWFQFTKQPLNAVFAKLERYYNVKFIIAPDSSTSKREISGKLDLKSSLEDVMKALSDVAQISYGINNNQVLINEKSEDTI
ncbi:MAG: FecR family protein [Bacteroidales bacterium]